MAANSQKCHVGKTKSMQEHCQKKVKYHLMDVKTMAKLTSCLKS